MADEFIASSPTGNPPPIREVERAISGLGRYVIEESSVDGIALRFSSKPRRPDWPEDFVLRYSGPKILLTIHSATKHERDEIVRDVETVLQKFDGALKLEMV